jgi:histone-lysine N-methyltransferase EZH2
MASSSSKASDSSSQRPKVRALASVSTPRARFPTPISFPNLIGLAVQRPDQGPSGKDAAGLVALHGKLAQLKRQVQSTRLAAIKERVEANRKALQVHTCALFDVAAAAEVASRGAEGGNALSRGAAEGHRRFVGWDSASGPGERELVHVQEENLVAGTLVLSSSGGSGASHRTVVQLVKLPVVDKIPPYTTWIFLDKYNASTRSLFQSDHLSLGS